MTQFGLVFACVALLATIARQDYLVPALRSKSISAGLTGPGHVALDAAYVPMVIFLPWATYGHPLMFALALVASLALVAVAVTNTAWRWVDGFTAGHHALWHSRATSVVFAAALLLELAGDHGALWGITAASIVPPLAIQLLTGRSDVTEKVGTFTICVWLVTWVLTR